MKNSVHTSKLAYRLAVIFLLTSHGSLYATEQQVQQHCLTVINYRKKLKFTAGSNFLGKLQLLIQSTDKVSKGKRGSIFTQLGFIPKEKDIAFIVSLRWAYVKGCEQAGINPSIQEPAQAEDHLLAVLLYGKQKQKETGMALKGKLEKSVLHIIQEDEITAGRSGTFYKLLGFTPRETTDIPFLYALKWAYQGGGNHPSAQDDTVHFSSDEQESIPDKPSNEPSDSESSKDIRISMNSKNPISSTTSNQSLKGLYSRPLIASNQPPKPIYRRRDNRPSSGKSKKRAKLFSGSSNGVAAEPNTQSGSWLPLFLVIGGLLAISAKISHSLYHVHMKKQKPVRFTIQKNPATE